MKNTLLYYQGGGYDGCVWEWNFCFWDADGVWYDLYSSGCDGADTEIKAKKIADELNFKAELIDLTSAVRFKQFQQDNNAELVLQIARELNENYNYTLEIVCAECDCSFTADRCDDDIAIDGSSIICYECRITGTCDCCNEYVGDTELRQCDSDGMVTGLGQDYTNDDVAAMLADLGYYSVCNDCFEYNKEEFARAKLEDLRFQAFCTGEPDMFSEELREYWEG